MSICDACEANNHAGCHDWCECTVCQTVVTWHDRRGMPQGLIVVRNGQVELLVDDDFYNGFLSTEDAVKLALAILKQHGSD